MKKGWLFLSILVLFIFSFNFVLAQEAIDKAKETIANWELGQFSPVIAKYMFAIIVFIFILPLISFIPMMEGKGFGKKITRLLMALIVSFLATAYLTPQDIQLTLVSYSAMGMVLGGILPLILLMFFTIETRKKGEMGGLILSTLLWIAFVAFLIYKIIDGFANNKLTTAGLIAYLAIVFFSLLFTFFGEFIMRKLYKAEFNAERDKVLHTVDELGLVDEAKKRELDALKKRSGIRDNF